MVDYSFATNHGFQLGGLHGVGIVQIGLGLVALFVAWKLFSGMLNPRNR
ncbi:MAG: hypothetical protein ACREM6_12770 [Vulcanimicrobiaceae bacterium]